MNRFVPKMFALACFSLKLSTPQNLFAANGDVKKGKAAFAMCAMCHNADSTDAKTGPGLKGLFNRPKLANGKPTTDQNVRGVITDGSNQMPGFDDKTLTPRDKDNLIAYLRTL